MGIQFGAAVSPRSLGEDGRRLLDDLFHGGFDMPPARAEAQHADSGQESLVDGAAGQHHLAAGVDPLEQPAGRLVLLRRAMRRAARGGRRTARAAAGQPVRSRARGRAAAAAATASARFSAIAARSLAAPKVLIVSQTRRPGKSSR